MFDLVESLGGSISAEHGIGRLKAAEFARRADPVELAVMHALETRPRSEGHFESGQGSVRKLTRAGSHGTLESARVRRIGLRRRARLFVGSARHPLSFFGPRDEDSTAEYLEELLASQRERAAHPIRAGRGGNRHRQADRRLRSVVDRDATWWTWATCSASQQWGKGYATEIALALVDAAFFDLRARTGDFHRRRQQRRFDPGAGESRHALGSGVSQASPRQESLVGLPPVHLAARGVGSLAGLRPYERLGRASDRPRPSAACSRARSAARFNTSSLGIPVRPLLRRVSIPPINTATTDR